MDESSNRLSMKATGIKERIEAWLCPWTEHHVAISNIKYQNGTSEAIHFAGLIKYLVNTALLKYNECTGKKDTQGIVR